MESLIKYGTQTFSVSPAQSMFYGVPVLVSLVAAYKTADLIEDIKNAGFILATTAAASCGAHMLEELNNCKNDGNDSLTWTCSALQIVNASSIVFGGVCIGACIVKKTYDFFNKEPSSLEKSSAALSKASTKSVAALSKASTKSVNFLKQS